MSTPYGVFEFRYFFSAGYSTGSGDGLSATAVKKRLAGLIAAEDSGHPLSDQKLADLLAQGRTSSISRRTVAKYREGHGYPSLMGTQEDHMTDTEVKTRSPDTRRRPGGGGHRRHHLFPLLPAASRLHLAGRHFHILLRRLYYIPILLCRLSLRHQGRPAGLAHASPPCSSPTRSCPWAACSKALRSTTSLT